jgi:AcrR family transcriptional regulator
MNVQSTVNVGPYIIMEEISEKKRLIFESALDLIRERGFHGAPMSLVAGNAGVAAGTIYHYFKGKDDLIRELYAYNRERVSQSLTRLREPARPGRNASSTSGTNCMNSIIKMTMSLFSLNSS